MLDVEHSVPSARVRYRSEICYSGCPRKFFELDYRLVSFRDRRNALWQNLDLEISRFIRAFPYVNNPGLRCSFFLKYRLFFLVET